MSKSLGNVTAPQDVIKQYGADILRLWVAPSDYADDLRIGPEILKTIADTYRKLRNTLRWLLGALADFREEERVAAADDAGARALRPAPPGRARRRGPRGLRRLRLQARGRRSSRLLTPRPLGLLLRHPQGRALLRPDLEPAPPRALTVHRRDLPPPRRPGSRRCSPSPWRRPGSRAIPRRTGSVHLETFPTTPRDWRDEALAARWAKIRRVRRVVTGALEIERATSASARASRPRRWSTSPTRSSCGRSRASTSPRSASPRTSEVRARAKARPTPSASTTSPASPSCRRCAEGRKCARSWKIPPDVGTDPDYPDVTPRDAAALREWESARAA